MRTLNSLLQEWSVVPATEIDNSNENWFYVVNSDGTVAGFVHKHDALRFRLNEINRILNG